MKNKLVMLSMCLAMVACKKSGEQAEPSAMTTAKPEGTTPGTASKPETPAAALAGMSVTTRSPEARAAFDKGLELTDNFRFNEAAIEFDKATQLDADFALAYAYLSVVKPGAEAMLDKAKALIGKVPAAEQLRIQAMLADASGDTAAGDAAWKKLATESPGD
jgi:hypothetical protein